jgi:glycerol-3-phosphate dehydrogenase
MMHRFIENYQGDLFDVIVVGGGITGAAIAYDAAKRGFTVALLEKGDFGGATSGATSKLIHGGLRYLKNMELSLVRESLRERKTLQNIAPNFVYPIPTLITQYGRKWDSNFVLKTGMMLYDLLSLDKGRTWDPSKRLPLHRFISSEEVLALEPNVKKENLRGAAVYYDCISIYPERLTLAFIKSAVEYGALVSNWVQVESFVRTRDRGIVGVKVIDHLTGRQVEVKGQVTINCGGAWADILLDLSDGKHPNYEVRRSEGVHFITDKLISNHMIMSITRSGRHVLVIPWRRHSLIGTTDKVYVGNPDYYRVTKRSLLELLDEVNECFGEGTLAYGDIKSAYGGLRPLVGDQTENTYESS